ncbi:MAG: RDD family protein [Acidimicrobiia bacterium]
MPDSLLIYFFRRFGARVIDIVAVAAISLGVATVFGITTLDKDSAPTLGAAFVQLVIGVAYEIPATAVWGQTLGKRATNLRVVRVEDNWVPGWGRASLRYSVYIAIVLLSNLLGLLGSLVGLWALLLFLFDSRRQNVPDKAARTLVVRAVPASGDVVD